MNSMANVGDFVGFHEELTLVNWLTQETVVGRIRLNSFNSAAYIFLLYIFTWIYIDNFSFQYNTPWYDTLQKSVYKSIYIYQM